MDKKYRKKGIAQMLMKIPIQSVKDDYKDVNDVVLDTTELQQPSIRLYKKFGFTEMHPLLRVKNWYSRTTYEVFYFRLSLNGF